MCVGQVRRCKGRLPLVDLWAYVALLTAAVLLKPSSFLATVAAKKTEVSIQPSGGIFRGDVVLLFGQLA